MLLFVMNYSECKELKKFMMNYYLSFIKLNSNGIDIFSVAMA